MKKIVEMLLMIGILSVYLTGCVDVETSDISNKSVMAEGNNSKSEAGGVEGKFGKFDGNTLTMRLDVPGEDFKLETVFGTGDYPVENWKTTDVKCLNLDAHTVSLPAGTEVYIDNVHIDSAIKSLYAAFDGVPIDTMDDRTHTSMYPGFPIFNDMQYKGVFAVGGYSDTLIEGYTSGSQVSGVGTVSGYVRESRVTERALRNSAVYGNMFQIVWDLWIKKPENEYPYMTSVISEFIIPTEFVDMENKRTITMRYNGESFDGIDEEGNKSEYKFKDGKFIEAKSTTHH